MLLVENDQSLKHPCFVSHSSRSSAAALQKVGDHPALVRPRGSFRSGSPVVARVRTTRLVAPPQLCGEADIRLAHRFLQSAN